MAESCWEGRKHARKERGNTRENAVKNAFYSSYFSLKLLSWDDLNNFRQWELASAKAAPRDTKNNMTWRALLASTAQLSLQNHKGSFQTFSMSYERTLLNCVGPAGGYF